MNMVSTVTKNMETKKTTNMRQKIILLLLPLLFIACQSEPSSICTLREGFQTPPKTARPGVYWYFMDGHFSREGVTKDLEAMKKTGIGYVVFLEVNLGFQRGDVDFMSDEWIENFKYTVSECERLDIQMVLGLGPGWNGSGGPWVKGKQSMRHLMASTTIVDGGGKVNVKLPVPDPNPPFFGDGSFTPEMRAEWESYYEDVAVLALPEEEIGATLSDMQEKGLFIRMPYSSFPGVRAYMDAPVANGQESPLGVKAEDVVDVTRFMDSEGTLQWEAPEGKWRVLRFCMRNNGANTRPAPLPGIGMECDKFSRQALEDHLKMFTGKLLEATGEHSNTFGGLKFLHMDSWEMGSQNWTDDFRQQFEKRRGYDPLPFYSVLTGIVIEDSIRSERFLWDLRKTCQELVLENHATAIREYAAKHGMQMSVEPYDMNPVGDLELGVRADLPMCEFWGNTFNTGYAVTEGSSAAHVIGQPVVGAESFTSHLDGWRRYPGNMKDQTDWALAAGINRMFFHTFQHQALPDSLRPGMTMGPYGVHWDRNQTWWDMADAYHSYLTRCQYMLQQGRTVADILYLTPEGNPCVFRAPGSAFINFGEFLEDRKTAYNFDGCPPSIFMQASVKDGKVTLPGGAEYSIVEMPQYDTCTPEMLEKIYRLIRQGATVVGLPPKSSPSLTDYPKCDSRIEELCRKIWGTENEQERKVGKGRIIRSEGDKDFLYQPYGLTADILSRMGVQPDFAEATQGVRMTHRTTQGAEIYFLANRKEEALHTECSFRITGLTPEVWNPLTGEMKVVKDFTDNGITISFELEFGSHETYIVVFSGDTATDLPTYEGHPQLQETLVLNHPWQLTFDPKWGTDKPVVMEQLTDWTEMEDPDIRYYSGTATYETTFSMPEQRNGEHYLLDLGTVNVMAHVWVNGKDKGILWTDPWSVDVTDELREGENTLKIDVVNLWQNRLVGDEIDPEHRRTYATFQHATKDDALLPSGLLGPVRIFSHM